MNRTSKPILLDGKEVAAHIKQSARSLLHECASPCLAIYTVGEDDASKVYVHNKKKACAEMGIEVIHRTFENCRSDDIIKSIQRDSKDDSITAIMVQLPIFDGDEFLTQKIVNTIAPEKDVDGLTAQNMGLLRLANSMEEVNLIPCTARGIIDMLDYYHIPIEGKKVVVLGRSNIVGKPIADLLLKRNATVIQCHSKTFDIFKEMDGADIIISAIGKPKFINWRDLLSRPTAIIDVGINRDKNGKLCGDIDFDSFVDNDGCDFITPVPGGVGPVTVAELMYNICRAAQNK